jgi:hypothetical protein
VGVAAQRVADEDHVVALWGEGAVGLVCDADRVKLAPAVELDWVWEVQVSSFDRTD